MRTTSKEVPIEQPPQEHAGQASRLRSKQKKQGQLRQAGVTPPEPEPAHITDMETHVFIEEQEDDLPNPFSEEMQSQTMVQSYIFCGD